MFKLLDILTQQQHLISSNGFMCVDSEELREAVALQRADSSVHEVIVHKRNIVGICSIDMKVCRLDCANMCV